MPLGRRGLGRGGIGTDDSIRDGLGRRVIIPVGMRIINAALVVPSFLSTAVAVSSFYNSTVTIPSFITVVMQGGNQ